jgi:hypothetical protein
VGSSPANPLTNEHIIAKWLAGPMRGTGRLTHAYREHSATKDARRWSAKEPSFKAGVVCRECNTGWMNDLEIAAGKYLPPFMRAKQGLRVNYVNSPVLARWAAKTALMFQGAEPPANRIVPREHYPMLRQSEIEILPAEMRVWIGSVDAAGVWSRAFAGTLNLPERSVRFYAVLLAIDRVAFMIMGADEPAVLKDIQLGHLGNGWMPLWPMTRPAPWPPPYVWPADQFAGMPQLLEALVGTHAPMQVR